MTGAPASNLCPLKMFSKIEPETTALDKLQNLAVLLEDRTIGTILWYLHRKKWPRRLSRGIRFTAIVLAIIGGLWPLAVSADLIDGKSQSQLGYVFIALAGSILLTDRYFGFSSSWMRFMTVQMSLQRALEKFQLNWTVWQIQAGSQTATPSSMSSEQISSGITMLSNFQTDIGSLIDQEFQTWVAEFKEQLANLQATISKDKEDQKPGNIVVSINAATDLEGPRQLYVDNQFANQTENSTALLTAVSPGTHLLTVKAVSDTGAAVEGSQTVTIVAGQTGKADIALK